MEFLISIGELAELRGVSTDTLRHYDKIGLLSPSYVHPENQRRFYTMTDCEKLRTIKELQRLGMSLKEIQEFMKSRTPELSLELLTVKEREIQENIERFEKLKALVHKRKADLMGVLNMEATGEIRFEDFPERHVFYVDDKYVEDEYRGWIGVTKIEALMRAMDEDHLVFGNLNYTSIIPLEKALKGAYPVLITYRIQDVSAYKKYYGSRIKAIPAGKYACLFARTKFRERREPVERLLKQVKEAGYTPAGDILQVNRLDYSVTNDRSQAAYDFQVRVEKD